MFSAGGVDFTKIATFNEAYQLRAEQVHSLVVASMVLRDVSDEAG